jgi:hypothetical protein
MRVTNFYERSFVTDQDQLIHLSGSLVNGPMIDGIIFIQNIKTVTSLHVIYYRI